MLTHEQTDLLLNNLGSPAAPLAWFARLGRPAGPLGWLFDVARYLVLIIWSVGFVWLWSLAFVVFFLWDYFGPGGLARPSTPSAPPPAESHHG